MELNKNGKFFEKDTVDVDAIPVNGYIYKDGPWSLCVDDVISDVARGGSALMRWIPTRKVITRTEHVAHLSWIAPKDFDGSTSYIDYLAALDPIAVCDFGPTTDWQACEYTHTSYPISFQSDVIKFGEAGMLECENQPIYRVRGGQLGMPLDNDADWALARVQYQLENHMNWNLIYGDPTAGQLMYDGLDVVIENGWVAAHAVGPGSCDFTDPLIVNGTALGSPEAVLTLIKGLVRKIRQRAMDRGVSLTGNDMAVVMPRSHWNYISDAIAWGALAGILVASPNIVANNTITGFFQEKARVTTGGMGFGFIEIDGVGVPVILDDIMGVNGTLEDESVVTGDIFILTRTFGGVNILEHQFKDWSAMVQPAGVQLRHEFLQNGIMRAGYKVENETCYQYFIELEGRLISRFQPLQAKITDVTVSTILTNENEAPSFAAPDFYAFNGGQAGGGSPLLVGLGAV